MTMPMKLMSMLMAAGFLVFSSPAAAASYYISCTNNMINVTSRSVAVLKRGFADLGPATYYLWPSRQFA